MYSHESVQVGVDIIKLHMPENPGVVVHPRNFQFRYPNNQPVGLYITGPEGLIIGGMCNTEGNTQYLVTIYR
jgi:hypothetical protein